MAISAPKERVAIETIQARQAQQLPSGPNRRNDRENPPGQANRPD